MIFEAITAAMMIGDGIARAVNAAHNNRVKKKMDKVNSKLNKVRVEYDRLLGEMQSELRKKGDQQAIDRLESEKDRAKQAKLLSQYLEKEASDSLREKALAINNQLAKEVNSVKDELGIKLADINSITEWKSSVVNRELNKAVSDLNAAVDAHVSVNTVSGQSRNATRYNLEMANKANKAKNEIISEWEKKSTIQNINDSNSANKEKDKLNNKTESTIQQMHNNVNAELDKQQTQANADKDKIMNQLENKHDKDTITEMKQQQEEFNKLEQNYQEQLNENRAQQGKLETTLGALQNSLK